LLPLLDEADILDRNLAWYAEAGIATAAFDNASSDDTHSLCQDALRDGRLARYERSEQSVTWPTIGDRLISLAAQLEPDLVLVAGADEFIEEARGLPLRAAVETDLASGYDILEVRTMEFCLTDQDDPGVEDPLLRMRRYSPHVAVMPDRGVRWSCGVQWEEPDRFRPLENCDARSPRRYVNRHYPLRSPGQALTRARAGRLTAVLAGSSADGAAPYVKTEEELVLPARKLPRYADDHNWTDAPLAAELRLAAASRTARRSTSERRNMRRELTDLRQRYSGVVLERDRLAATGATPMAGQGAASAEWYDEQYRLQPRKYDSHYSGSVYLPVWKAIGDRLDRTAAVLEVGCGTGQLAQLLIGREIQHYTGFDFSDYAVELARKRVPHAEFHIADARTTSLLTQARYDVVVCTEVLEHLDEDLGLLHALKPHARVLATVPNFDSASHLRFFASEREVLERYGEAVTDIAITSFSLSAASVIYLLDGFIPQTGGA
jgi:2-polyprenyl-3-methyl-5-hydroxy-6-metoxy-1,4-benzoquinol methylase